MTTIYGVPEQSTQRLGEQIARLRTSKGLSRARMVKRLPDDCKITEPWLKRLEEGKVVKVSRDDLEALSDALRCTPRERNRLFLYADRSPFSEPSLGKELLMYSIGQLYCGASEILESLAHSNGAENLNDDEFEEIVLTALEAVLAERRAKAANASLGKAIKGDQRGQHEPHADTRRLAQQTCLERGVSRK